MGAKVRVHYTNQTHPTHFRWKKCLSSTPVKKEKIFIKCAQNRMCTFSMYEQSLGKKGMKNVVVTDYTN